jgi:hypothetical protein
LQVRLLPVLLVSGLWITVDWFQSETAVATRADQVELVMLTTGGAICVVVRAQ